MGKKKKKLKIGKFLIRVIVFGTIVAAGVASGNKTVDNENNNIGNKTELKNEIINDTNTENNETAKKDSIRETIAQTNNYYWQNPSEDYEEGILMGMQGYSICFEQDGTFSIDGGNGNWHEGSYEINGNTIICRIERNNSAWHLEEEILETTTEIKFMYNEQSNSLEVINIEEPALTIHVIDMITGELTEETKEYSLDQFTVGNIYGSENKYEATY